MILLLLLKESKALMPLVKGSIILMLLLKRWTAPLQSHDSGLLMQLTTQRLPMNEPTLVLLLPCWCCWKSRWFFCCYWRSPYARYCLVVCLLVIFWPTQYWVSDRSRAHSGATISLLPPIRYSLLFRQSHTHSTPAPEYRTPCTLQWIASLQYFLLVLQPENLSIPTDPLLHLKFPFPIAQLFSV